MAGILLMLAACGGGGGGGGGVAGTTPRTAPAGIEVVEFSVSTTNIAENGGTATVTLRLSEPVPNTPGIPYLQFFWSTNGVFSGSDPSLRSLTGALLNRDYTARGPGGSGDSRFIIRAGSDQATVTITALDDDHYEGTETIIALLTESTLPLIGGVQISLASSASDTFTLTITDDEIEPTETTISALTAVVDRDRTAAIFPSPLPTGAISSVRDYETIRLRLSLNRNWPTGRGGLTLAGTLTAPGKIICLETSGGARCTSPSAGVTTLNLGEFFIHPRRNNTERDFNLAVMSVADGIALLPTEAIFTIEPGGAETNPPGSVTGGDVSVSVPICVYLLDPSARVNGSGSCVGFTGASVAGGASEGLNQQLAREASRAALESAEAQVQALGVRERNPLSFQTRAFNDQTLMWAGPVDESGISGASFGMEWASRDGRALNGVALSATTADLSFSGSGGLSQWSESMTLIAPYLSRRGDSGSVWASAGIGSGEVDLSAGSLGGAATDSQLAFLQAGAEWSAPFTAPALSLAAEGSVIRKEVDGFQLGSVAIPDVSADVARMDVAATTAWPFQMAGGVLAPRMALDLSWDGADTLPGQEHRAVSVETGMQWSRDALSVFAETSRALSRSDTASEELSAGMRLELWDDIGLDLETARESVNNGEGVNTHRARIGGRWAF